MSELSRHGDTVEGRAQLLSAGAILGILQQSPEAWFQTGGDGIDAGKVEALIAQRNEARVKKDYASADAARDALVQMGVVIEDTPNGTIWRVARS